MMTVAEYLAWEATQVERYEFVNGEIVAMAGGSFQHAAITTNLTVALANRLRKGPCRVLSESLRVAIDDTDLYAYPDLSVVCGPARLSTSNPPSLLNPSVLVEVLSPSTRGYDLDAKAAHYRHCASVVTLLFVDSTARMVQRQDRNPDGTWTLTEQTEGEVRVLGVSVPMDEIYDGIDFEHVERGGVIRPVG